MSINKLILMLIAISILMAGPAYAKKKQRVYFLDKGITVLTFIGKKDSLRVTPVKLTSYESQQLHLFHKKSGPGVYAFHLEGFVYKNKHGFRKVSQQEGYFMVRKRHLRVSRFYEKRSMKYKTDRRDK